MAPGASPLIPVSVPQGSDFATAAPRPVSDMGFLAFLPSGPASALAQSPIAPDSPGVSSNDDPAAMAGAITSGPLMGAPIPVPKFDLPGGEPVPDTSGPVATATPLVAVAQSAPIRIDPIVNGAREQPAAIDPRDPVATVANSSLQPLRQPALDAPEMSPAPPTTPAQGPVLANGSTAPSPVVSVQPAMGPPAPVETVAPPSSPVPAFPDQPAFPADGQRLASAPAAPSAMQAPKTFPDAARAVGDVPAVPDRSQATLRSDTQSPVMAPPPTSQKAGAPDPTAIRSPETGTAPKPTAVTATDALATVPIALRGSDAAVIADLDGPSASTTAQIKTQETAPVWPNGPRPDSAKAAIAPGDAGDPLLPPTPVRKPAAPEQLPAANLARPDAPREPSPAPRMFGQAATSDLLSVSSTNRPIFAPEPSPEPNPMRQGTAPETSPARRTIRQVVASGLPPAFSPDRPSTAAQPVPVSSPARQGAAPELAPAALSPNATHPPALQPNTPTVQQVSGSSTPPPGPALAPNAKFASSALDRATPSQPLMPAERSQPGSPLGPQMTRPNLAQGAPLPARDIAKEGDAFSTRISDAPPPAAPPLREVSGQSPASAPAAALARAEQVAAQITAHLATASNIANRTAPLEIALDPPELGQLRISVTRGDDGIVLNVAIDRPETLELMRRHASLLSQEFQRQGLENTGFTFSGRDGGQPTPGRAPPDAPGNAPPENGPDTRAVAPANHTDGTSLDIRI
jgi:Flagellar hook-length control protein FliK